MIRHLSCVLAVVSAPVFASDDWKPVLGDEMRPLLDETVWDFDNAWQQFYASGRTNYNAGRDSWGYWEVRGEDYCSQWPPAGGWACYRVETKTSEDLTLIKFIGDSGDETIGRRRE